MNVSCNKM